LALRYSATSAIVVPGPKVAATPAYDDEHVVHARLAKLRGDPRHQRHVRARQDRQADDVGVLLERGGHDHVGRLAQARVDDLEALVAQPAGEHLRAAIVAVEARLRNEHLQRSISHRPDCTARS
jgi:hypothetical protein